ncbi:MAG: hypothetical protein ACQR33_06850 [Candidatus Saccharibacteria bacterium]
MVKYPEYSKELTQLLSEDQEVWKSFWRDNFDRQNTSEFHKEFEKVRAEQQGQSKRMLEILRQVDRPTLTNIGADAAQAVSILALHDSLDVLRSVLDIFIDCYEKDKTDAYCQAIPSMTDRVRILERKPQVFGTQWELDEHNYPFLPTVEDFEHVNERREAYGIEPLRWPKSLAIPEDRQPWLKKPLSGSVMRDITDKEFQQKYQSYLANPNRSKSEIEGGVNL